MSRTTKSSGRTKIPISRTRLQYDIQSYVICTSCKNDYSIHNTNFYYFSSIYLQDCWTQEESLSSTADSTLWRQQAGTGWDLVISK